MKIKVTKEKKAKKKLYAVIKERRIPAHKTRVVANKKKNFKPPFDE